ncbi:MAG: hypothetical protein JNN30_15945 [Rhodanobacteraceae bacterium]|nr:hypothetical protein [Rhodanobacteraceae bacterium]
MSAPFDTTAGNRVGQLGMTLSSIAYAADQTRIESLLADTSLATGGDWTLVWYARDAGNQVFVVQHGPSGQYAIAIRGSVTDPKTKAFWIDWLAQDLSVFRMADWPYGGAPAGARISHGSLQGLSSLLLLKDAAHGDLVSFFRNRARPYLTAVVGHSLGGALASMLAPYLQQQFSTGQSHTDQSRTDQSRLDFWPVTFAGTTAGNDVFADWLSDQFAMANSRYYNVNDLVPHAFQALDWIRTSFPDGPKLPIELIPLLGLIRETLKLEKANYAQPGAGVALQGRIDRGDNWFAEAGLQHSGANYLALLGAPPVNNGG